MAFLVNECGSVPLNGCRLTQLSISAVGNSHVSNGALNALSTLTGLRKLVWIVGGMQPCVACG